jgi:hypothetical protein
VGALEDYTGTLTEQLARADLHLRAVQHWGRAMASQLRQQGVEPPPEAEEQERGQGQGQGQGGSPEGGKGKPLRKRLGSHAEAELHIGVSVVVRHGGRTESYSIHCVADHPVRKTTR